MIGKSNKDSQSKFILICKAIKVITIKLNIKIIFLTESSTNFGKSLIK